VWRQGPEPTLNRPIDKKQTDRPEQSVKSIADGGEASDADIDAVLEAKAVQLAKEGF
jgi:hypothetical protein